MMADRDFYITSDHKSFQSLLQLLYVDAHAETQKEKSSDAPTPYARAGKA